MKQQDTSLTLASQSLWPPFHAELMGHLEQSHGLLWLLPPLAPWILLNLALKREVLLCAVVKPWKSWWTKQTARCSQPVLKKSLFSCTLFPYPVDKKTAILCIGQETRYWIERKFPIIEHQFNDWAFEIDIYIWLFQIFILIFSTYSTIIPAMAALYNTAL